MSQMRGPEEKSATRCSSQGEFHEKALKVHLEVDISMWNDTQSKMSVCRRYPSKMSVRISFCVQSAGYDMGIQRKYMAT